MKKIKFEIHHSGAPYPSECWWKIISSNGQIYVNSELMNLRNARKVIKNIITAVKTDKYEVVEVNKRIRTICYPKEKK